MATATLPLTHYWPYDPEAEPGDDGPAVCGAAMTHSEQHSAAPTCPSCAAHLFAEDYGVDVLPTLAAQADAELPTRRPLSPLGAELMALALTIARLQVARERGR